MKIDRKSLRRLINRVVLQEMLNPRIGEIGSDWPDAIAQKVQTLIEYEGLPFKVKQISIKADGSDQTPREGFDETTYATLLKVGFTGTVYYIETDSNKTAGEVLKLVQMVVPDVQDTFFNSGGNDFLTRTVFFKGTMD